MRAWAWGILLVALAGCSTASRVPDPPTRGALLNDALFAPPSERIEVADIFALSEPMRHFLHVEIAALIRDKGKREGLADALYRDGQLRIQYDAELTRNAAQAFEARSGNCLSLVIMTAALAKELGQEVRYQRVFAEDLWSRAGGLQIASVHINITIGRGTSDPRPLANQMHKPGITIDFIPLPRGRQYRAYPIDEATVIAMFLNNRAAEAYAAGRIDDAYWWVRASMEQDPAYLASYNTLGAIYHRHGTQREAERVFAHVLEREPANTIAMSNLALVYRADGRAAEAKVLTDRLAAIQPFPPFHFFDKGMAAMRAGDYAAARDYFRREVERDSSYHEFHFWLGAALGALGDREGARKHLAIAMENSTTRSERDLYAAKLDRIGKKQ
jgi:tetratricopeptide (TPR) repeat protein